MIGSTLAHYEILDELGRGGMGVVYRARDTKLGREVAIKVLPAELAEDSERLSRFEREAKLLAQLNHPGIATLHGFEKVDGTPFLVMELVEGETLAERIARGPIPWDEARALFTQIAEAIEAAHGKGVLHRDLKPANIKITPDGRIKILDFGLAKALQEDDIHVESSQSPTRTRGTALGAILGTASYMSPEQARGKELDRRTDIWAFGCCLYEALTGRKAFDGETVSDIFVEVLKGEPDWGALPPTAPVRGILRRCLEKEPKRRLRDIGDVWLEGDVVVSAETSPSKIPRLVLVAVGALMGGVAVWLGTGTDTPTRDVRRMVVTLPPSAPMSQRPGAAGRAAISPDGKKIAYVAEVDGGLQIYLRALDRLEPTPVNGTEGAQGLFFSPSGEDLAFVVGDILKRVRLDGSAPLDICDGAGSVRFAGGAWMEDDSIVFSRMARGLFRVPAFGGEPELWAAPDIERGDVSYRNPQRLPDGWVLFSIEGEEEKWRVGIQHLSTGERLDIDQIPSIARYIDSGHLLYGLGDAIVAVPFDLRGHAVTGPPVSLAPELTRAGGYATRLLDVSRDGTLVYWHSPEETSLTVIASDGTSQPILSAGEQYKARVAPDGERLVVEQGSARQRDLWVYSLNNTEPPVKLTFGGDNRNPVWTPDGERIVFTDNTAADWGIVWTASNGSQLEPELLVGLDRGSFSGFPAPSSISRDGKVLLFYGSGSSRSDVLALSLDEDHTQSTVLGSRFSETRPHIAPDGRMLAYTSNRSGRDEVWLRSYPNVEATPPVQVSKNGGTWPVWSPDSRELYYMEVDAIVKVMIVWGDGPRIGAKEAVVSGARFAATAGRPYDVTGDGRIVLIQADNTAEQKHLVVVDGWFEELRRLERTSR